jgi:hypothetical protein
VVLRGVAIKAAYRGTGNLIGRVLRENIGGFTYGDIAILELSEIGRRVAFLKVDPVMMTANVKNGYGFYKMSVDKL